ncbi:LLM class flavin-dependent oxidoreductase [Gammaproteobacteria bacterium]|nr:LLM class flavin-dependent oxidoreductase [Gammaproteobacteria bacterium]
MQFSLFAHMERLESAVAYSQLHDEFIALCQIADDSGMSTIWTGEHHGMNFTIAPNPFITIADLAHHTQRIRLGTGTVVAPFWHPIKLAGEAAMTDLICDGRLEIGIARGAYSFEYERLMPGLDAWQAGQRMRELVPLLRPLWAGDCAHDGEFFSFPSSTSIPAPLQASGPPLWVAARDPNSHQFAVEHDCNVQVTPLWQGMDEIELLKQRFDDAVESAGKRPKIMLLQHSYAAKDSADADRAAAELSRFYHYFGAWFKNERPISQGTIAPLQGDELSSNPAMAPAILRENLTIGTAPELIDRLKRIEDLGYDEFSFWIDSGMSFERKRDSLRRFIDDVMPAF